MIRLALDRPVELTNQETPPSTRNGRRWLRRTCLELSSHRLEEAERQVEAEFAARKARVIAKEKADQYDPDKAMDQIAKLLAKGYVEHR